MLVGRSPLHHALRAERAERVHKDDHPLRAAQRAVHVVIMMSGSPPLRYETNYLTPTYVERLRSPEPREGGQYPSRARSSDFPWPDQAKPSGSRCGATPRPSSLAVRIEFGHGGRSSIG